MAQVITNSGHDDMIVSLHNVPADPAQLKCALEAPQLTSSSSQHDAVLDYYGRRLATCSSDRTVKIFEVDGESPRLTETLKGCVHPNP